MKVSLEEVRSGIEGYVEALNEMVKTAKEYEWRRAKGHALPVYKVELGSKYAKIEAHDEGSRRVHSFVDRRNGDILKAASWRGPAKHARGSVLEEDFGIKSSGATVYGVRYL